MAAFLYEGVLLFGIVVAVGFAYGLITQQRHGLQGRTGLNVTLFLAIGLYFVWFWTHGGQTLAMKTWRLRLVDRGGGPVPPARAVLRYLLSWMWFVPIALASQAGVHATSTRSVTLLTLVTLGWMAFYALLSFAHPQRQFWHDALAGTRLVDVPRMPS